MNLEALFTDGMGEEIFAVAAKIYPICRSITGNGLRDTLHHIRARVPSEIHECRTGTAVFDWTIPREVSLLLPGRAGGFKILSRSQRLFWGR
jgi:aminopeptidase-like protein